MYVYMYACLCTCIRMFLNVGDMRRWTRVPRREEACLAPVQKIRTEEFLLSTVHAHVNTGSSFALEIFFSSLSRDKRERAHRTV